MSYPMKLAQYPRNSTTINATPIPPVTVFKDTAEQFPEFIKTKMMEFGYDDSHNPVSNLDNAIHPVFDISHWTEVDTDISGMLKPALRLASLWLTDDRVLDWFYQNTTGTIAWTNLKGRDLPYLVPNPTLSSNRNEKRRIWLDRLSKLSQVVQFFLYNGEGGSLDGEIIGLTLPFADDLDRLRKDARNLLDPDVWEGNGECRSSHSRYPYSGKEINEPRIFISDIFWKPLNATGTVVYLNCCFVLAGTLCHEICHALHYVPVFRYMEKSIPKEVYSSKEEMEQCLLHTADRKRRKPEAGWSWGKFMFGNGTPYTFIEITDPFTILRSEPDEEDHVTLCSSKDVAQWFRKEH